MTDKYDVEVRLLAITPDAEKLIETAGRLCWDTQDKTGTVPDRIQKWLEVGHESMIEHACATFYIRASRVLTHELVRHRLASYSQRHSKALVLCVRIDFKGSLDEESRKASRIFKQSFFCPFPVL